LNQETKMNSSYCWEWLWTC